MVIQVIAGGISALVAGLVAYGLSRLWRATRLGLLGSPLLAAAAAAAAAQLLVAMDGGRLALEPETGMIIWAPVASCAIVGFGVGFITALAIGLMRIGGRARR